MKTRKLISLIIGFSLVQVLSQSLSAQILIEDPARPQKRAQVGEKAARGYFEDRESTQSKSSSRGPAQAGTRYLSLHFGSFINDKQYRWGDRDRQEDVGELIAGLDYRMGQWTQSMDLLLRAELVSYDIDNENPLKLSLMPVVTFPDLEGGFPLYFGAGAGVGVFFRQLENESDLSFDYNLLAGVRFPEMFEGGGLIFETGLKGQVHILSSGQFSGVYLTVGGVFSF
jgi:hypothetical protein